MRASNIDAMARYNKAVDRALRAGGDAIGAKCEIRNLPGYLPLAPDDAFREVLRDNAVELFGKEKVTLSEHSSGSTDMGDVSLLMPVIHPWVGCVDGVLHGADYELRDPHPAGPGPHDRRPARRRRAEGRRNLHGLQAPA